MALYYLHACLVLPGGIVVCLSRSPICPMVRAAQIKPFASPRFQKGSYKAAFFFVFEGKCAFHRREKSPELD